MRIKWNSPSGVASHTVTLRWCVMCKERNKIITNVTSVLFTLVMSLFGELLVFVDFFTDVLLNQDVLARGESCDG